jgi:hypothetical protein
MGGPMGTDEMWSDRSKRVSRRKKKEVHLTVGLGTEISSIWPEPFSVSFSEIPGYRGTPLFRESHVHCFTVYFPKNFQLSESGLLLGSYLPLSPNPMV